MEPFIGEIRPLPFNFAPVGYLLCDGSLLSIAQYETLYSVIGTIYGGDGVQSFALPNIKGNVLVSLGQLAGGSNYKIGQTGGVTSETLTGQEMPQHSHGSQGAAIEGVGKLTKVPTASKSYLSNVVAKPTPDSATGAVGRGYSNTGANKALAAGTLTVSGGSQPHENMMPFLVINYCIAIQGIYPSRS